MNKPFKKVGFLGVAVIVMSIVLVMIFPSKAPWMMDGFFTPIVAFEFVQSQDEVMQLFGPAKSFEQQAMIHAMDLGNRLDYLYMTLYASFLFFFAWVSTKVSRQKRYYAGCIMAVVILAGDAFENVQLLAITAKINGGNFADNLVRLHWFTWMKWGGLALFFLLLAPYFFKKGIFSKLTGVVGILPAVLSVLAYLNRCAFTEAMVLSVALMFILLVVYSFTHKTAA